MKPTPPKNAISSGNITRRRLLLGAVGAAGASMALAGCGFALRGNLKYAFKSIHIAGSSQSPVAVLLAR